MKIKHIPLIVAFLFIAFQTIGAKPKALLRLNLEKDASYQMTMTADNNIDQEMNGQKMKILQKMEMVASFKVLDKLPDNNYVIEYSFQKLKLDMDVNGQKMVIDSESTDDNEITKNIKTITSFKLKFTINPMGKVLSVDGIDEYAQKISNNPQLAQSLSMLTNENNFKATFEQNFGFYPENEVEVGSNWDSSVKMPGMMNMDLAMHFNVADIQDDQVVMDVNSDLNIDSPIETNGMKIQMKMTGTQTGTMTIDRKSGLTGTSDLNQKFDMHMKFQNPQTGEDMEMPMQMNSVSKTSTVKI
jgi:hypothetical protein